MLQSTRGAPAFTLRASIIVLAAALLVWTFRDLDFGRVQQLLSQVPAPALALILVPQLLALGLESTGWCEAFAVLGQRVPLLALLRLRVSTEALAQTLPAGVLWAESIKPALLDRWCGVPLSEALAGMAARKYLLVLSQSVYVLCMALFGFTALERSSVAVIGVPGLPWLVLLAAGILLAAAMVLRSLLSHGALAARLLALLLRLPSPRLRRLLQDETRRFHETDGQLRRFFAAGGSRAHTPALWLFAGWLLESLETFIILRTLGVDLDFTTVAAFEVALCFVRNVVFVLPSGIGLHDLGYVTFLAALGVAEPVAAGAAFMILKRGKEAFWALVGYALLATGPRRSQSLKLATESA